MNRNQIALRVNFGDTDAAGIVFYPNYFKWFDIAGHQFFRSLDMRPDKLQKEHGIILPMMDVRCTFERPLYYADIITIKTEVEELNEKTIKLSHQVFRGEERTGYGYELRGWVKNIDGRLKAVPIDEEFRKILAEDRPFPPLPSDPWLCS